MNIDDLSNKVHEQLIAAAALGDERTREIAAALADSGRAAVRLAILDAVSATCGDVNAALFEAARGAGSPAVTMQLESGDVHISLSHPPVDLDEQEPERADDGDATARISLRLSERLKAQVEEAAGRADVSVNTWIVRTASAAVNSENRGAQQPYSPGAGWSSMGNWQGAGRSSNRISGWVTG